MSITHPAPARPLPAPAPLAARPVSAPPAGWHWAVVLVPLLVIAGMAVGVAWLLRSGPAGGPSTAPAPVPAVLPSTAAPRSATASTVEPTTMISATSIAASPRSVAGATPDAPAGLASLAVTSISAPAVHSCAAAPEVDGATQLTLRWSATGAASVSVAIDDPNGTFLAGLPPSGELVVPAPCAPDLNTYYVVAVAADGRTVTASVTTEGA